MEKRLDDIYHSAHVVETLMRHGIPEYTADEIAYVFLSNTDSKKYSIHDQNRIDFLDSLTESDDANAWKNYLNSRSEQVINTDKRALEKYLFHSIKNLMKKQKINKTFQWSFQNNIDDIWSIIWSKKTLDFVNDWQAKNPDWWNNLYKYVQLSHIPWSSVPWNYYSKN